MGTRVETGKHIREWLWWARLEMAWISGGREAASELVPIWEIGLSRLAERLNVIGGWWGKTTNHTDSPNTVPVLSQVMLVGNYPLFKIRHWINISRRFFLALNCVLLWFCEILLLKQFSPQLIEGLTAILVCFYPRADTSGEVSSIRITYPLSSHNIYVRVLSQ